MLLLIYIIEKLEKTIIKFSEFFLIKFFLNQNHELNKKKNSIKTFIF